jgi:hypothetical protein
MDMKRAVWLLLAAGLGLGTLARAEVNFGLEMDSGGVNSFYLNVSNYYNVPQERVMFLHERRIPDEEIPVVLFLAGRAHVGPEVIVEQRLGGRSWMDIALVYHVDPGVFYVPMSRQPGPPYGHAYGYYKHHRRGDWNKIRLADADVVNMVNLRFVSEHYGYSPDEVARFRSQGGRFERVGHRGGGKQGGDDGPGRGAEHGKSKGRGHGKKG